MLLGTTAISTLTPAESVFAYRNNQATSQVDDCGNGFWPENVGCQNTGSQIQGDKNTVALSSQQTFPPGAHMRINKNSNITQFYTRLAKRKGNSKAVVAAASKLLKVVYWLIKEKRKYLV
jgi:hypothetical protein